MKKRLISMLMAVLMIASLLPAAALADVSATDTHEHKYTTVSIKKDAEKKTPGVEYKVCKECGKIDPKSISIKAFALLWNQCMKCETGKTMVVKAASCRNEGLTISYCEKCGKAFTNKDFGNSTYKIEKALEHVYGDFTVVEKPTCKNDGWGFAVCKLCGDPKHVASAKEATDLLDWDSFKDINAYKARFNEVNAMYAKTNPNHDAAKLVTVTKDTVVEINGETITLQAAEARTHADTISGKYDPNAEGNNNIVSLGKTIYVQKYSAEAVGTGYVFVGADEDPDHGGLGHKADKYCPDCGYKIDGGNEGTKTLNDEHNMTISEYGYAPYVDEKGIARDGKTDIYECTECHKKVGGTRLPFKDYFNPNDKDNLFDGVTFVIPAVAADCSTKANGVTATTLVYNAKDGWTVKTAGKVVEYKHNMVEEVGEAPSCEKSGFIYKNYKVCTNDNCTYTEGNENDREIIPANGHKPVDKVLLEATCQHRGMTIRVCATCGKEQPDEKTGEVIKITDMVAHTASDKLANVKEATCTEVGYTGDKVCKFCNTVMEEGKEIPMIEHTPMDVDAKAPTCTEPGVTKGTVCKVCGTVLSAQETVPALGHKTELVNAKEATCLEAGYTGDKVCTVCKQTIEKGTEVKALGHNYVKGVCTRCDAKQPGYNPFTDVKKGPYYDAILWAYCNGVTNGISDTVFGVDNGCTRAQIVTFLYRAAGQPKVENVKNPFTDVSKNSTYYNAIMWAVENGITTGKTATSFDPNAVCTRGQIVTFLWRYEKAPIVSSLAKFDDVAAGYYCYNAVMWAVENGITTGKTTTTFAPNDTCTRAQAVTFIYREFAK